MKLNLLKPLKRIFTALSGEETEEKNLISVMNKIADTVEEKDGSDSGNNDSENEKFFIFNAVVSDNWEIDTTIDATFEQLYAAVKAGKVVCAIDQNNKRYFPYSAEINESDGYAEVQLNLHSLANIGEPTIYQHQLRITLDNENWENIIYQYQTVNVIPPINKDTDVGKILTVASGGVPRWVQPS